MLNLLTKYRKRSYKAKLSISLFVKQNKKQCAFFLLLSISVVFIPRERASIFLSYNECLRRMNCGISRKEECSEECANGKSSIEIENFLLVFFS